MVVIVVMIVNYKEMEEEEEEEVSVVKLLVWQHWVLLVPKPKDSIFHVLLLLRVTL